MLDDKQTRDGHGLVSVARWASCGTTPGRLGSSAIRSNLHPVFLRLMERFDLSYLVAGSPLGGPPGGTSLIAQLVPDVRPDPVPGWPGDAPGDEQQVQICRIVETRAANRPTAEGLFYQLIVRLHKYSLGARAIRRASTGSAGWCWTTTTTGGL